MNAAAMMKTIFAASPMPNQMEISGIQARMAIWRNPLKVGLKRTVGDPRQAQGDPHRKADQRTRVKPITSRSTLEAR